MAGPEILIAVADLSLFLATGFEFLIAASILSAVTTTVGAIQASSQAKKQARVAEQNARIAIGVGERNAKAASDRAASEEDRLRSARRRQISAARAAFGSAGVQIEGTPLEVLSDMAREAEADALLIRHQGVAVGENARLDAMFAARRNRIAAEDARARAGQELIGGFGRAGATLLGGLDEAQLRNASAAPVLP